MISLLPNVEGFFATRSFGEVYYPGGRKSGTGYVISSPDLSRAIRLKLRLISGLSPVWAVLLVLAYSRVEPKAFESFFAWAPAYICASWVAGFISDLLRQLISRGLRIYNEPVDA